MNETKRIDMGRFHWDRALEKIIDYETCESYYDDECVEILNDINYQNFKFEKENGKLKKENNELKNENWKLKNTIGHYADITACSVQILNEDQEMKDDYASILSTKMFNIVKENEQLKQKIKSITEILNEDIGYIESFRKIEEVIE